jgi:hypothetical protein
LGLTPASSHQPNEELPEILAEPPRSTGRLTGVSLFSADLRF